MRSQALRLPAAAAALSGVALANVVIGAGLANGRAREAVLLASVPALFVALGALIASNRGVLVFGALALGMVGGRLNSELPLPGTVSVYPADVLVLLALGSWVAAWLAGKPEQRPRFPRTPVLGWPLVILATVLTAAVVRGHERYGVSLFSGPVLRLALYAGIAAAIGNLTARSAYKGIVVVFYAGTIWHAGRSVNDILHGGLQAAESGLSTGGTRITAVSTSMYLVGALVLALLNLSLDERAARRAVHLGIAALATFGIVVSFGRATYLVVAFLVPLLMLGFKRIRAGIGLFLPLSLPALVLVALALPRAAPDLAPTFERRISTSPSADTSVRWREKTYSAVWEQIRESPITGVGYGRPVTFVVDDTRVTMGQDPHNSFLFLWAVGGLLALGSFVLVMLVFLRDTWQRFRASRDVERALVVWAFSTWLAFMANMFVQPFLSSPKLLLTLWIAMLLPALVRRSPEAAKVAG